MHSEYANPADTSSTVTAYIALGSNVGSAVGDPVATVEAAMARLGEFGEVTARSSLYKTDPVGSVAQPDFINAAVALRTALPPQDLLHRLLRLEREFGRDRTVTPPKGPRSLDLDILLMGDTVLETPELTLPHPAMAERRFVLAPLAEIAPDAIHPVLRESIAALLADLPSNGPNQAAAVRPLRAVEQAEASR